MNPWEVVFYDGLCVYAATGGSNQGSNSSGEDSRTCNYLHRTISMQAAIRVCTAISWVTDQNQCRHEDGIVPDEI